MTKDAVYKGTREVRTFVDLAHGADVLIQMSEQSVAGNYYTTMSALLLSAFMFEAYLNHLGAMRIKFWENIESIRVMEKYSVICKELDLVPDFSRRPYQTLKVLFKFRNAIAHGKSQVLKETKELSSGDDPHNHTPKTDWEEYCTLENARRAKEDVAMVIKELHIQAGLGDYPFMYGIETGLLSLKESNKEI